MPQVEATISAYSNSSADYLRKLTSLLDIIDCDEVEQGVQMILDAWNSGHQIITLGNGGSAVTALHFVTDWNKAAFLSKRRSFRGRTLVDNVGLVTAYANDVSYDKIFSEQLANIAVEGDLVVAISGSGNSKNVVNAIDYANESGCVTLGLCGFSGGELRKRAKHSVWAPVNDMQLCEDVHAIFGHIVMKALIS